MHPYHGLLFGSSGDYWTDFIWFAISQSLEWFQFKTGNVTLEFCGWTKMYFNAKPRQCVVLNSMFFYVNFRCRSWKAHGKLKLCFIVLTMMLQTQYEIFPIPWGVGRGADYRLISFHHKSLTMCDLWDLTFSLMIYCHRMSVYIKTRSMEVFTINQTWFWVLISDDCL